MRNGVPGPWWRAGRGTGPSAPADAAPTPDTPAQRRERLSERDDLLAYLGRYAERPRRQVRRAERWRVRGWTGAEIVVRAGKVAVELRALGVGPGDRVALHLNDGPMWHAAFFGVQLAGAVAVPFDVALESDLLSRIADDLELAAWCSEPEVQRLEMPSPHLELDWRTDPGREPSASSGAIELPEDDPGRVSQIVLTSGTSGVPQAVPVTHRNIRAVLDALAGEMEEYRWLIGAAPPLRLAVALPLSHLYGQTMGVYLPALLGARVTLLPTLPATDMARLLRREGVWMLAAVPRTLALLGRLLRRRGEEIWGEEGMARRLDEALERPWPARIATFRRLRSELGWRMFGVISGGAALDRELEDLWRALGYLVVQGYGLTETAPLVTLNHPFDPKAGSLGRPLPGVQLRIAADGEILVRGANVVTSRLGGSAVDGSGWLHTGDLGRLDDDGRLEFLGRKGERIVTPAGVNVDPGPVVEALRRRPGVIDAVVRERPWGREGVVCAVLALRPGAEAEAIVDEVNRELPDAARIRSVHVWPESDFPRTHTGKARRGEIDAWLRSQAPEETAAGRSQMPGNAAAGRTEATPDAGPRAEAQAAAATGTEGQTEAFPRLAALVARITGVDAATLQRDTRIADAMTSLDRVELATELEMTYGLQPDAELFTGDATLAELAVQLGGAPADRPQRIERRRRAGEDTAARTQEPVERGETAAGEEPAERGETAEGGDAVEEQPVAGRRPRQVDAEEPSAPGPRPPLAWWRTWPITRAARWAMREAVMRPLWHLLFRLDAGGLENLDGLEPPFLIAGNHLSVFDPGPVLFSQPASRRAKVAPCAMWEHFLQSPGGRLQYLTAVLGINLVPLVQVGDWRPTLRVAGTLADRGHCLLIYPEGRRSLDGELLDFRLGVAVMARDLHLPILPYGATGLLSVLPEGAHWPRNCWGRRAPVAIRYGEPLPPPRPGDDLRETVTLLRERVDALHREALAISRRH